MAEFAASLFALLGTGIQVGKTVYAIVKGLKNAPDELLLLANEITTTNQTVDRARHTFVESHVLTHRIGDKDLLSSVGIIVSRAQITFENISRAVVDLKDETQACGWKRLGRLKWLRRREDLLKMQVSLRECRNEIAALIGIEHINMTSRLSLQVNTIHEMCKTVAFPVVTSTEIIKSSARSEAPLASFTISHSLVSTSCQFPCGCACHRQVWTSCDTGLLGSIFLGSTWSLFASPQCTEKIRCKRNAASNLQFTYHFPAWYVKKAVSLMYCGQGPQFTVRLVNIVPEDHDMFGCAKTGDLAKLKMLLASNQASPTDIDHDGDGLLICTLELREFSLDMCNFVVSLPGVDPLAVNRYGQSFVSLSWQMILGMDRTTRDSDSMARWLMDVITKYGQFEDRQLGVLHKIVTDYSDIPLCSQLQTSTADIDLPDAAGWTPLMWAAYRHNAQAIHELLDFDADANLYNIEDQHVLHLGAWSWNPCDHDTDMKILAWQRLISKSNNLNHVDRYKWTPLMYAAGTNRNVSLMKALVDAGADVSLAGHAGITPLHWASQVDRGEAVSYLLEAGADFGATTVEDKTPLHLAIIGNAHDALLALTGHSAVALDELFDMHQLSLLLDIAEHADVASLLNLALSCQGCVDVNLDKICDGNGKTLFETFQTAQERQHSPQERSDAWQSFLEKACIHFYDAAE